MITEKTEMPDSSPPEPSDSAKEGKMDNNGNALLEKPNQDKLDDQYPHGLKLVILAAASISAVFLIALDQVSTLSTYPLIVKTLSDTMCV